MQCHLIEQARGSTLDLEEIKSSVEYTESIFKSDKFDVGLGICKSCGQIFISCFREYNTADFKDYYWLFWVPATETDIQRLRAAKLLIKFMAELIASQSHICCDDEGSLSWKEGGLPEPLALTIFLPV